MDVTNFEMARGGPLRLDAYDGDVGLGVLLAGWIGGLTDGAVVLDRNCQVLAWNRPFLELIRIRPRSLQRLVQSGVGIADIFRVDLDPSTDKARGADSVAAMAMESRQCLRYDELPGRAVVAGVPEQEQRSLIVSAIPVLSGVGEVVGAVEIYRDVTAEARIQGRYQRLLEREKRRADDLELLVRQRTMDLEESLEELKTTRAHLVRSEKLSSLGRMAAGLAHEINNPMNFLYGNIHFFREYTDKLLSMIDSMENLVTDDEGRGRVGQLKEENDYDFIRRDLGSMVDSMVLGTERVSGIVRDLRSYIHDGAPEQAIIDLRHCVDTTINILSVGRPAGLKLTVEVVGDLPEVWAHEGQITQCLVNLVNNAMYAAGENGVVTVSLSHNDGFVEIAVRDSGPGIDEEAVLKLFDPFYTTKPVGEGTGMGLAITYAIISAHGGAIEVDPALGRGATFILKLPIERPPQSSTSFEG